MESFFSHLGTEREMSELTPPWFIQAYLMLLHFAVLYVVDAGVKQGKVT